MQGEKKNEEQRLDLDIRSKQQEKLANDSTMSHINKLKVQQYQNDWHLLHCCGL
jgi:hypothetical protein